MTKPPPPPKKKPKSDAQIVNESLRWLEIMTDSNLAAPRLHETIADLRALLSRMMTGGGGGGKGKGEDGGL